MNKAFSGFICCKKENVLLKHFLIIKRKALQDNPKMAELKQGFEMGIEVPYTISYKLPNALVKVVNPNAKISDDKRTVSVRNNLLELFSKPEQFEFTIEY